MIHHLHPRSISKTPAANDAQPWGRQRSHVGRQLDPGFDYHSLGQRPHPQPLPPPDWLQPALDSSVERKTYLIVWRSGFFHGAVIGIALAAVLMAALHLGINWGA